MEYRDTEMIELHDSNVVVRLDSYSDAIVGWSGFPEENEDFYIDGDMLHTFLKMVGVTVQSVPSGTGKGNLHMKHLDLPITRRKVAVGRTIDTRAQHKIVSLKVKIESPQLIHIRFVSQWDDDGKEVNATQELTYSGRYTIWWPHMADSVEAQ